MSIRTKLTLLLLTIIPSLFAQEIHFRDLEVMRAELPGDVQYADVVELPENQWSFNSSGSILEKGRDLWLRVSLPPVFNVSQLYLTENKGIHSWELFLVKEGSLIKHSVIDWTKPLSDKVEEGAQFRGFTYVSFLQSPGSDYSVYIHIRNEDEALYNFILSSSGNFNKRQQFWSLIQGMGLGYYFMIVVLAVILIIKMKYLVNWLYLLLVLISGVSIFYVSGSGLYLSARIFPGASQHFWYLLLGLFTPVVILYIKSFIDGSDRMSPIRHYFNSLLAITLLLAGIPLFTSSDRVFFFVNIQTAFSFLFVCGGLFWLSFLRIKAAWWLLAGWLFNFIANILGYTLSAAFDRRTMIAIVFHLISQGILVMLFGGAMILDLEEKFNRESTLRENAEALAKNAVDRMSSNERMADLGRLVTSVTHELGNPLGVAVTLSTSLASAGKKTFELFEKNELSEDLFREFVQDVRQSSELIYRNMEQARSLVNGFKVVASDQVVPDIRTFDLENYIMMIQKVVSPVIKRAGCTLEVSVERGLTITSIPGILTQVLSNLVNNAVMHGFGSGQKGNITLQCRKENGGVLLSVEDNGRGVPPDIQDKIFDIYFTTKKGDGGTGVGLSIVRSLVEKELKGSINFESHPGTGTVFTINLPDKINAN